MARLQTLLKLLVILIIIGSAIFLAIDFFRGVATKEKSYAALNAFYTAPWDKGANLPADGFYPHGRRFAFMG